ncbi:helix-turn-helix domain-containing protein [Microbulbifer halophilus]|uniref:Helix-turn-helix domain-containing protein n=1 Tax=Microbulbifer halophilus TaxID=453963 RepID=A0ABW5E738_9GAMM|nr:helix-turn-helix transcriptional regulator [Microbulbifer halophilus]MCW8125646.1 helix-turn-helix transcriptional regulator [Microbulbifer halophilus]
MSELQKLKERALQTPEVRHEYDALEEEFELIDKLLKMRTAAGLTQEELAQRMGTQKSNICRLERGNTNPSWKVLKKYAHACGFEITVEFHAA